MNAQQRVGKKLKKVRKEKGLRQIDVAKKVGCSLTWYSQIEQGKVTNPGSLFMNKIANVLELDPSEVAFV